MRTAGLVGVHTEHGQLDAFCKGHVVLKRHEVIHQCLKRCADTTTLSHKCGEPGATLCKVEAPARLAVFQVGLGQLEDGNEPDTV